MKKNAKSKKKMTVVDPKQNILNKDSHFSVIEAYKAARTNIMFTLANEEACKKIMVVSTEAGEGKSTTALNLAMTFAQTGAKVLVVEADLRKPILGHYLDLKKEPGLSEYLGGFIKDSQEIIQQVNDFAEFDCIVSGHIPPNPSELLMSLSMVQLLDTLAEKYDYIFIDTPPLNYVSDAAAIAKIMTGTVVVARQNVVKTDALEQAISSLEFGNGKILGYIFNGVQKEANRYYSYKQSYQKIANK